MKYEGRLYFVNEPLFLINFIRINFYDINLFLTKIYKILFEKHFLAIHIPTCTASLLLIKNGIKELKKIYNIYYILSLSTLPFIIEIISIIFT